MVPPPLAPAAVLQLAVVPVPLGSLALWVWAVGQAARGQLAQLSCLAVQPQLALLAACLLLLASLAQVMVVA